jgi:hypothetical protein
MSELETPYGESLTSLRELVNQAKQALDAEDLSHLGDEVTIPVPADCPEEFTPSPTRWFLPK